MWINRIKTCFIRIFRRVRNNHVMFEVERAPDRRHLLQHRRLPCNSRLELTLFLSFSWRPWDSVLSSPGLQTEVGCTAPSSLLPVVQNLDMKVRDPAVFLDQDTTLGKEATPEHHGPWHRKDSRPDCLLLGILKMRKIKFVLVPVTAILRFCYKHTILW